MQHGTKPGWAATYLKNALSDKTGHTLVFTGPVNISSRA